MSIRSRKRRRGHKLYSTADIVFVSPKEAKAPKVAKAAKPAKAAKKK